MLGFRPIQCFLRCGNLRRLRRLGRLAQIRMARLARVLLRGMGTFSSCDPFWSCLAFGEGGCILLLSGWRLLDRMQPRDGEFARLHVVSGRFVGVRRPAIRWRGTPRSKKGNLSTSCLSCRGQDVLWLRPMLSGSLEVVPR